MEDKLQKELEEKQYVAVLNNTKWKKLIKRIQNLEEHGPKCSTKYLLDPKSPYGFSYLNWEEVQRDLKFIEWIMIQPQEKSSTLNLEALKKILEEEHIPFAVEDNNIKIYGYYKTIDPPI